MTYFGSGPAISKLCVLISCIKKLAVPVHTHSSDLDLPQGHRGIEMQR